MLKEKKGSSIIEVTMLVIVLGIVGSVVVGVILFFMQLFVYTPRALNVQKIGQELNEKVIEGDALVRGLRYATNIIDASSTQLSYTYGHLPDLPGQSVRFRWSAVDKKIYRSTSSDGGLNWSGEIVIPQYLHNNTSILIDGKDVAGVIFTYKKVDDDDEQEEEDWVLGSDPLTAIRRVIFSINVKTGTGSFKSFHGSCNLTSGVEIKKVQ